MKARTVLMEGRPVPKARPRVFRGHAATPKRTQQAEAQLLAIYMIQNPGEEPFTGPVGVDCSFYMPIATSWSKSKKKMAAEGLLPCKGRPDIDNLTKLVLDALNGFAFKDDSQIIVQISRKLYSGEYPDGATIVQITDLE